MDKIMSRIRRRKQTEKPAIITNDNIDEHRENVLKKGKKFKYPFQYSRHKVLINSLIIAVSAAFAFSCVTALMLYVQQTRDDFFYTVTKVVPLPVASVDGETVRYSDYLLRLRSSIYYMNTGGSEVDINTAEGADLVEYTKRHELTEAEKDVFAKRLAREHNVTVSDEEVDNFIDMARKSGETELSLESFETGVLRDLYGQTLDEFKSFVRNNLLRGKVSIAIDDSAKTSAESILAEVVVKPDSFNDKAREISDDEVTKANDGKVIDVSLSAQVVDTSGVFEVAKSLNVGQISELIAGVDGYYIVKLDAKTDSTISYSVIKIALHEFDNRFEALQKGDKISEYITIKSE